MRNFGLTTAMCAALLPWASHGLAHEIADEVEARIKQAFPAAEVLIHQDPEGVEEPPRQFL